MKFTLSPNRLSHSREGSSGSFRPLDSTAVCRPTDFRNVNPRQGHFYHRCVSRALHAWKCLDGISLFVRAVRCQRLTVLGNQTPMAGDCEMLSNLPFKCNPGKAEDVSHWIPTSPPVSTAPSNIAAGPSVRRCRAPRWQIVSTRDPQPAPICTEKNNFNFTTLTLTFCLLSRLKQESFKCPEI